MDSERDIEILKEKKNKITGRSPQLNWEQNNAYLKLQNNQDDFIS